MPSDKGKSKVSEAVPDDSTPPGTRRLFWLLLAAASSIAIVLVLPDSTLNAKWKEILKKIIIGEGETSVMVRHIIGSSLEVSYQIFLAIFGLVARPKSLNLPRHIIWLLESAFLVACLCLPQCSNNFADLLLGFLMCFHLIPLANLVATIHNGGSIGCFVSLLLAIVSRIGMLDQWTIALVFVAFHAFRHFDQALTDNNSQHECEEAHKKVEDNKKSN